MSLSFLRPLLFDFGGRVPRLPFIVATIAVGAVVAAGTLAFLYALPHLNWHRPWGKSASMLALYALVAFGWAALIGGCVWASIALVIKRIRDVGLPVGLTLAAYYTVIVYDQLFIAPLFRGAGYPTVWGRLTALGGAMYVIGFIVLLLAPPRGRDENAPSAGGEGVSEAVPV